jgi:hypothetical protein
VTYVPTPTLRYLNLSLNSDWVVQNAPILPTLYQVRRHRQLVYFPLADEDERDVRFGARLTTAPLGRAPRATEKARLRGRSESYYTGVHDTTMPGPAVSPPRFQGAPLVEVVACRLDYPNQPCGKNECGPAAVSNSLKWLDKHYGLGIPAAKLTINAWKKILDWAGDGVKNGQWANLKVNYCNDKNNRLPIDSTKLPGAQVAKALKEFKRGQAVEMFVGNHITALICMGQDSDGNYVVNAISDAAQEGQGKAGKPVSQLIHVDSNGRTISGPAWAIGKDGSGLPIQNFLVQCPHPNKGL